MHEIVVNYGTNIQEITRESLENSDLLRYLKNDMRVAIKPNLVVSRPAHEGATTHPEVVLGIILFLKDMGIKDIKVIESSWVGDNTLKAFEKCGYKRLSEEYGVTLIDLKSDSCTRLKYDGYEIDVFNEALNTDFLINVPVLKAHCQTLLTCCIKNLKGCITDEYKRKFHSWGLSKPIASLSKLINVGYNVIDSICGDLSFEEGGSPVTANRIIVGRNPVLLDSYAAGFLGYKPQDIAYLNYAKAFGAGDFFTDETSILELNKNNKPKTEASYYNTAKKFSGYINENAACSACHASLIFALNRLDKNRLNSLDKINIGQHFKGKKTDGIGIGNCTSGCDRFVPGCPPKAVDILELLSNHKEG